MTVAENAPPKGARSFGYRRALDGVRGVAIIPVVILHVFGRPHSGILGVDLFFVLSGFLITSLLLIEKGRVGRISLRRFFARRLLRLYPALLVLTVAYAAFLLLGSVVGDQTGLTEPGSRWGGVIFAPLYVANIVLVINVNLMGDLTHLWSLATEEQFYLLWPTILAVCLARGVTWSKLVRGLAMASVALVVTRALMNLGEVSWAQLVRFDALLIGCIAGFLYIEGRATRLLAACRDAAGWSLLAVALGMALMPMGYGGSFLGIGFTLFSLASAALILGVVDEGGGRTHAILESRPLVALGRVSYGLYLWHIFVIILVRRVESHVVPDFSGAGHLLFQLIEIVASILVAWISYRWVEAPFLKLKQRLSPLEPRKTDESLVGSQVPV